MLRSITRDILIFYIISELYKYFMGAGYKLPIYVFGAAIIVGIICIWIRIEKWGVK